MPAPDDPSPSALRGRAIGVGVISIFGGLWAITLVRAFSRLSPSPPAAA